MYRIRTHSAGLIRGLIPALVLAGVAGACSSDPPESTQPVVPSVVGGDSGGAPGTQPLTTASASGALMPPAPAVKPTEKVVEAPPGQQPGGAPAPWGSTTVTSQPALPPSGMATALAPTVPTAVVTGPSSEPTAGSTAGTIGSSVTIVPATGLTYVELPDGRGGTNIEPVGVPPGFDKAKSLAAFQETVYPLLQANCSACHSTANNLASGGQAPLHADQDVNLAHEYALTRVYFRDPANSKLVVRMRVDRHHCFGASCADAGEKMLAAVEAWKSAISDQVPETLRTVPADTAISEEDVLSWIATDKQSVAEGDRKFMAYASLHELHNEGMTAEQLNVTRAGISKALNSVARWAPEIVNPVDINDKGMVYRFDIRAYWGYNKGVKEILPGSSDDDLAFGQGKTDREGNALTNVQSKRYDFASEVSKDEQHALAVWTRVLYGNVEGAVSQGTLKPFIDGFKGPRTATGAGHDRVKPEDLQYVEASQLVYTLTRPDVYNSIMLLPFYAPELETELGLDISKGVDSYKYVATYDAITVDSRMYWLGARKGSGFYWKTWDVFSGQLAAGDQNINQIYSEHQDDIRFPFWANPIPKFVSGTDRSTTPESFSFVATLAQPLGQTSTACDAQPSFAPASVGDFHNCRHYDGSGGLQQSASEVIWDLPNGLQGYYLTGGFNQRRVDAFTLIVRDPRILLDAGDDIATTTGYAYSSGGGAAGGFGGVADPRLNTGSSCIGCHADGMNRGNNDLRDWLDESPARLPKGQYGVDSWIDESETVERVRELYPPTSEVRAAIENYRLRFQEAMAPIKTGMLLGDDKNLYVEPIIVTVEYVQRVKYKYPQTTSN